MHQQSALHPKSFSACPTAMGALVPVTSPMFLRLPTRQKPLPAKVAAEFQMGPVHFCVRQKHRKLGVYFGAIRTGVPRGVAVTGQIMLPEVLRAPHLRPAITAVPRVIRPTFHLF